MRLHQSTQYRNKNTRMKAFWWPFRKDAMNDTGAKIMKSLIVYFSWTGCVAKMAEHLLTQLVPLGEVVMMRIVPVREHGYWGWLMRSFLPGWSVPIHPVVAGFGA